jgi:hypothetical protein
MIQDEALAKGSIPTKITIMRSYHQSTGTRQYEHDRRLSQQSMIQMQPKNTSTANNVDSSNNMEANLQNNNQVNDTDATT